MARVMAGTTSPRAALSEELEAFQAYAVGLHALLGSLHAVTEALELLLRCCGGWPSRAAAKAAACEIGSSEDVVYWCLAGHGLLSSGPEAVARALLLQAATSCTSAADGQRLGPEAGQALLAALPKALAEAQEPVAERLAMILSQVLPDARSSAAWLHTLQWQPGESQVTDPVGAARAYARAAGSLLASYPGGQVAADAWDVAASIMTGGGSAAERGVCMQHLLPPLVMAAPRNEVGARLSHSVEVLLENSTRAGLADALGLAVAFHGHLLEYWRMASLSGDHNDLGPRLLATGLRLGLKEGSGLRKQARFLLEASVQAALADASLEEQFGKVASTGVAGLSGAWRCYWELFDAIEDYSSHLLKSSWDALWQRVMQFLGSLPPVPANGNQAASCWPPVILAPPWLEAFLSRAFSHDNDTVQKFVLGQLLTFDTDSVRLSEAFVLQEVLPRFSHGIESLYPRSDVHRTFECKVMHFFSCFIQCHAEGRACAARRLLQAILGIRALHHTPLRLVLTVLSDAEVTDALGAHEALHVVEHFFTEVLTRMPVSVRQMLSTLLLRSVTCLCSQAPAEELAGNMGMAACASATVAAIPDNLLSGLQTLISALIRSILGQSACQAFILLLEGLVSPWTLDGAALGLGGPAGQDITPMVALKLALGAVRIVWALAAAEHEPGPSTALVWPVLAPALHDIHLRPYMPQRAAVAVLFACAYATALLPDGAVAVERHPDVRAEMLAYLQVRTGAAFAGGPGAKEEAPWVWLYALLLETLWREGLSHGEVILKGAMAVLQRQLDDGGGESADEVLALLAAVSILGVLAPKVSSASRRSAIFLTLWSVQLPKPSEVSDVRFDIGASESLGLWKRNRLEEHEDLHRAEREGLGRTLEWRDTTAVFLVAKWRALAKLSYAEDLLACLGGAAAGLGRNSGQAQAKPEDIASAMLAELETLQPPHVAFWTVVARRVVFPLIFSTATPADEQRTALHSVCRGLQGAIREGTGFGSTYMARGCMTELAATLCDPQLWQAEHALFSGEADAQARPLTSAVKSLLALGEVAVGVSRSVVVPLLASVLRVLSPQGAGAAGASMGNAVDLLASLLFHGEAAIIDGALCHLPGIAAGIVDVDGPGGERSLAAVCPQAHLLGAKFGSTQGLPRILTLAALDGLAEGAGGVLPPLVVATLECLLRVLRDTLEQLLHRPGTKVVANRPPTPMPMSHQHRIQLRGWQAVLVLGCHVDRATAARLLPELFFHLQVPHVPDVRDYQELLGCVLCLRFKDLAVEPLLAPALRKFDANVQVSSSLLVITCYLFRSWAAAQPPANIQKEEREHIACLVRATAPYLGHNAAYVRGLASWGFWEILGSFDAEGLAAIGVDAPCMMELHRFLAENRECQKMRGRLKPVFAGFDVGPRTALACLTEQSVVIPGCDAGLVAVTQELSQPVHPFHIFSDCDFQPTATFVSLLKCEIAEEMETLWDRTDPTTYPSNSESWQAMLLEAAQQAQGGGSLHVGSSSGVATCPDQAVAGTAGGTTGGAAGGASGLQRKFCPPEPPEVLGEASGLRPARERAPLLVVASLVDKTPNLAGLCRTCEVFHCQGLSVPNAKITQDQSFKSISVTAEKWLPINEVPRASLRAHLLDLRRKGYALVGVEQTHNSVPLDEWHFARHTALILGAEKEGIDAELLPLLDACVEIPQAGQLRSLNVHVSGSLVIWEYMRQHRAISVN